MHYMDCIFFLIHDKYIRTAQNWGYIFGYQHIRTFFFFLMPIFISAQLRYEYLHFPFWHLFWLEKRESCQLFTDYDL